MRVRNGIALGIAVLVGSSLPVASGAVTLPARDPAWWSPDASLRQLPPVPVPGPPHALFDAGLTGWTMQGPGRVDVRVGGPAHHYAAIRDNTTLISTSWTPPASAQIVTLWARALHQRETLRVGALIAGRTVVLGTIAPSLSWRRYAFPATPIRGKPVSLVLDPVMPFGDGIDVAAPGRTESPARGFVFDLGAATRLSGGPDGISLAAEPGDFLLRGAPFQVPRDAATLSLWLRAQTGSAPQVSIEVSGREIGRVTPGAGWAPVRLDASTLRGRSVRLRVRSGDATGLQLALIGTVQRAPDLKVAKARRDVKDPRVLHVVIRAPAGLAGESVRIEIVRRGSFRSAIVLRVDAAGRARAMLQAPLKRTAIRALYVGNEAFAPGVSPARTVTRAAAKP
ncbi:MAG: hypothetical protein QOH15_984 [Gaiellales bacterium]|nr:hypothetical protein [Gaiellales bacterium]